MTRLVDDLGVVSWFSIYLYSRIYLLTFPLPNHF